MRRKLGTKGEIVIPKEIRESLGLAKGSALVVQLSGRVITITPESATARSTPAPQPVIPRTKPQKDVDWEKLHASIPSPK